MFFKKNEKLVGIILAGLLSIIFLFSAKNYICRNLWYDEALTILEFVVWPKSYLGVYFNYSIPNNHILYSVFMRFWLDNVASFLNFSNPILRVPSLIAGLFLLISSFWLWRKYSSQSSVFIILFCLALSPVFIIYSTAIRGYIFSILLVSLVIPTVLAICENRKFAIYLYYLLSFIAIGIMPNNVVAIFASSLLPFALEKLKPNLSNIFKLCFVPFIALFVFYLPILDKFMMVLSIREGWNSRFASFLVFYLSIFLFFMPIIIIASSALWLKRTITRANFLFSALIFVLPGIFFFLRSPSPFPRTFICVMPVWLFIFSIGIKKIEDELLVTRFAKFAKIIMLGLSLVCIASAIILNVYKEKFAKIVSHFGQDDFFSPYFMSEDFRPDDNIVALMKLTEKKNGIIFVDQGSDPPSLTFSAKRFGMNDDFICFDKPRKKIPFFPATNNMKAFIVARDKKTAEEICARFGLTILTEEKKGHLKQRIFHVEKI